MDLAPVFAEALDILVRYLRIDTSNPPGNEKPAALFLVSEHARHITGQSLIVDGGWTAR